MTPIAAGPVNAPSPAMTLITANPVDAEGPLRKEAHHASNGACTVNAVHTPSASSENAAVEPRVVNAHGSSLHRPAW